MQKLQEQDRFEDLPFNCFSLKHSSCATLSCAVTHFGSFSEIPSLLIALECQVLAKSKHDFFQLKGLCLMVIQSLLLTSYIE
jgi:hypothetical protein